MTLVLPISYRLDPQAVLFSSPVTGFIGGVALHILNFLASEAVRFIEYHLTKVEGTTWSNHNAVRRVRSMTTCGLWGGGILLSFPAGYLYTTPNDEGLVLALPLFTVIGFGYGVITYFFLWGLLPILGYLRPRNEAFRGSRTLMRTLMRTLNQFYQKWKHHDYRS